MATSGTALLVHIYSAPNKTERSLSLSLSLPQSLCLSFFLQPKKNTAMPGVTTTCSGNGSGSLSSLTLVAVPDCVDNATQTDISFHSIMVAGRERRGHQHHHHHRHSGSSPPPPSPPLPHLLGPHGISQLYVGAPTSDLS